MDAGGLPERETQLVEARGIRIRVFQTKRLRVRIQQRGSRRREVRGSVQTIEVRISGARVS